MHIVTSTDILLPRAEDMGAWSVIACDQFTSEPEYWAAAEARAAEKPSEVVSIAGKCCESGDIVCANVSLPRAETGDILAVLSTGAYNYSMASNYNRNLVPPVVLVRNGEADYIVKPQSYEDLTRNDVIPEFLK